MADGKDADDTRIIAYIDGRTLQTVSVKTVELIDELAQLVKQEDWLEETDLH